MKKLFKRIYSNVRFNAQSAPLHYVLAHLESELQFTPRNELWKARYAAYLALKGYRGCYDPLQERVILHALENALGLPVTPY